MKIDVSSFNMLMEYEMKMGKLYFYEDFVVAEFNEGVHITFDNFSESRTLITSIFEDRPFGFIAHRKNNYSINLTDATSFNKSFPNLKAYAVVCNTLFGKGIFEIENQFFNFNREIFKDLESAQNWVIGIVNSEKELQ
ncbi:hypothetical protein [Winogradskyella sp. A3E31]|uniref:hypothetical protein n=1 Tax=Winogradskyella sp. A3E31 TaxID=3349637 RepID=UPI00398B8D29